MIDRSWLPSYPSTIYRQVMPSVAAGFARMDSNNDAMISVPGQGHRDSADAVLSTDVASLMLNRHGERYFVADPDLPGVNINHLEQVETLYAI